MIDIIELAELFLAFWALLIMGVAGVGAVMKIYEIVGTTNIAVIQKEAVSGKVAEKLLEEEKSY